MSQPSKSSARKVQDYLNERGFSFAVRELPASTRTAAEAAEAIGCSVPQIAKSLIFRDEVSGRAVLIIASGGNRVSTDKVEAATGLKLGKADGRFVREKTGFAIGGVPPVAHATPVITLLDPDLKQYETIWAAAGTPNAVFALKPTDLDPLTHGHWIDLAD